jgi:SagB-type dehydrogenase family enzyme
MDDDMNPLEETLDYHRQTVHHFRRHARSLGFMDWESQPNPYRFFTGCERVPLEVTDTAGSARWEAGVREGAVPAESLGVDSVARLFRDSLGLTAWKGAGEARWALRANPSSGNLHPTEGYLIAGAKVGLPEGPGIWHYQPFLHALERRAAIAEGHDAAFVALSTIYLRESWKYGERAFRYCHLDLGHAVAAVAYAAAGLGWTCRMIEEGTDAQLASTLGLGESTGLTGEHPDTLLALGVAYSPPQLLSDDPFAGEPNRLAKEHEPWPIIDSVHEATVKREAPPRTFFDSRRKPFTPTVSSSAELRSLIHQRRSAVDMDGETELSSALFFDLLSGLMPGEGRVPFATFPWRPRLHPVLFVHRVAGLAPGLYALVRHGDALETLQSCLDRSFTWKRPENCPPELPLYQLKEGDCRALAQDLSCGQAIASHGVFACAMLAEFEEALHEFGPWFYRRLYWEAGAIGQALYLGAEAAGIRGTGIGCFFDDETHCALGIESERLRDLYHFTVGGPVEDSRLEVQPPYEHLERFTEERGGRR